ncbi:MAG: pitrilysin family protein [Gammaproteobacteria bacterium]
MSRLIISLFTLLFTYPLFAQSNTHEFMLNNGLKLIVKEDHRAPVVISSIFYKIGSSYEPGGITGVSHVLEHMMFKGTAANPDNTLSTIIAENGGAQNAATGFDYTYYYQELEKQRLPISFELEADRMRNLTLSEEEFSKEIKVVQEERRMRLEDDPQMLTLERLYAAANIAQPYHHLGIGWMNDLEHMDIDDVRDWYNTWYAPNNAILVVIGDVDPDEVHQLAKQYFAAIPSNALPVVKPQREPPFLSTRQVTVSAPAELPILYMAYNVPSLNTAEEAWQAYALNVAAAILSAGNSARLAKEIVRKQQIAAYANADYDLLNREEGLFTLEAVPNKNHSIDDLKTALQQQIERLQNELVSEKELARIKTQVLASETYRKDSLQNQAREIGVLESIGLSWRAADEYTENIQKITAQQVQAVAQEFFQPERLTTAELIPLPINPPTETNDDD